MDFLKRTATLYNEGAGMGGGGIVKGGSANLTPFLTQRGISGMVTDTEGVMADAVKL